MPTWLDMLRPKAFGPSKQLAVNLGNGGPIGTETPSPLDYFVKNSLVVLINWI